MPYPALNTRRSERTVFSTGNLRLYYFVPSTYDHWLDTKKILVCRCLGRLRFLIRIVGACSNIMSYARPTKARICVEFVVDKWHWDRSLPSTSFLTCQLSYHQYFIFVHLSAVGWTLDLLAAVAVQRDTRSHNNEVPSNVTLNKRVLTENLESKVILHWFLVLLLHHWVGSFARENLPVLVASCSEDQKATRIVRSVPLKQSIYIVISAN
jgi:hypothetical protein